jgi:hypothetical protein
MQHGTPPLAGQIDHARWIGSKIEVRAVVQLPGTAGCISGAQFHAAANQGPAIRDDSAFGPCAPWRSGASCAVGIRPPAATETNITYITQNTGIFSISTGE